MRKGRGAQEQGQGRQGENGVKPPHTQKLSHMYSASVGSILVAMEPKHHPTKLMPVDQMLTLPGIPDASRDLG